MMTTKTLIGLACLLANKGKLDTSALEAQLTEMEKTQIQKVIEAGVCLPENMERLINRTNERIKKGELIDTSIRTAPTDPTY